MYIKYHKYQKVQRLNITLLYAFYERRRFSKNAPNQYNLETISPQETETLFG